MLRNTDDRFPDKKEKKGLLVEGSVEKQRWTGEFGGEKQIKWPECRGNKEEWVLQSSLERTFSEDGEDESGLRGSSEPVIVPGQEQNQSTILENESGRGVDVRLE